MKFSSATLLLLSLLSLSSLICGKEVQTTPTKSIDNPNPSSNIQFAQDSASQLKKNLLAVSHQDGSVLGSHEMIGDHLLLGIMSTMQDYAKTLPYFQDDEAMLAETMKMLSRMQALKWKNPNQDFLYKMDVVPPTDSYDEDDQRDETFKLGSMDIASSQKRIGSKEVEHPVGQMNKDINFNEPEEESKKFKWTIYMAFFVLLSYFSLKMLRKSKIIKKDYTDDELVGLTLSDWKRLKD